jgi:hypothetical protein
MERAVLVWQTLTQAQIEIIVALMLVVAFVSLGLGMFIGVKIAPQMGPQKRPIRHPQADQYKGAVTYSWQSLTPQVDNTRVRSRGYGAKFAKSQKYYDRHR